MILIRNVLAPTILTWEVFTVSRRLFFLLSSISRVDEFSVFTGGYAASRRISPYLKPRSPLMTAMPELSEMASRSALLLQKQPSIEICLASERVESVPGSVDTDPCDTSRSGAHTPPDLSIFSQLEGWIDSEDEEEAMCSVKDQLAIPSTVPSSPELCGLQSILPRQCGVRVLNKIGEGTFAKVVLALNRRNVETWNSEEDSRKIERKLGLIPQEGDKIVLKCIRKERSYGDDGLKCIRREVQIHQTLSHPHIPIMYGFYEDETFVTLILGFVDGNELQCDLLNKKQFEERETKIISLQVHVPCLYETKLQSCARASSMTWLGLNRRLSVLSNTCMSISSVTEM
jgi:hypothetical protein